MKTKRILSFLIAALMIAAVLPAGAVTEPEKGSELYTVTPDCGEGVTLEYGALTLRMSEYCGVLKAEENKTLTVTARFEEGWTYSSDYTSFFTGHSQNVTVTDNPDGSKTFSLSVSRGDIFTKDELYTVGIYAAAAELPKLEINAAVPFSQIGKEDWVDAEFTLTLGTKQYSSGNYSGTGSVKGRGNTSWGQPKKPYSIKLSSKASLLDIPKTKKYAIVPSYSDDSLVRNWMTYKASLLLSGIEYVPKCEFVEVYLNGTYNGIYILVERVDIESNK
ncbi:MAG: CotH kinase family protein, partial [Clostridia bacterium]|nr:CotH kinase family protein [Clostridia bacterium]